MQGGGLTSAVFIKVTSANSCSSQASWTPPTTPPQLFRPHQMWAHTATYRNTYSFTIHAGVSCVFSFQQEHPGTSLYRIIHHGGWTVWARRPHNCPPFPSQILDLTVLITVIISVITTKKRLKVRPTWDPAQRSSRTAPTTLRTASVRPCGSC